MAIANYDQMKDVEALIQRGYDHAKRMSAFGQDLGIIPYSSKSALCLGWCKFIEERFYQEQAHKIQWRESE